jgi:nucleotide-binding universal stress UspA family protein
LFENILVCLDGTKFSETILPAVKELALHFQSNVIMLNVIVSPSTLSGFGKVDIEPKPAVEISEQEKTAANYLNNKALALEEKGLKVQCITVEGTVEESIIACALTYHVSLITMAIHNHCLLRRLFLNNIVDYIHNRTGIPVLSINPDIPAGIYN